MADLLKERPPDVRDRQAEEVREFEGGDEGDLPFVLLNFVQGRNGKAGALGDLLQGQTALDAKRAKTIVHRDSGVALAGRGLYLCGVSGAIVQRY